MGIITFSRIVMTQYLSPFLPNIQPDCQITKGSPLSLGFSPLDYAKAFNNIKKCNCLFHPHGPEFDDPRLFHL